MRWGQARSLIAWAAAVASVVACRSEEVAPERKYFEPEPWVPIPTTPSKDPLPPADDPPRKPNPADGVCKRAKVSSGIVDPDCVYLLATEVQMNLHALVLIDPFRPDDRAVGFANVTSMVVHPRTGELWFLSNDGTRRPGAIYIHKQNRHPDTYTFEGMLDGQWWFPVPSCPNPFPAPMAFLLFPDDGIPAIHCTNGRFLVPTQSEPLETQGGVPMALGRDRVALVLQPPSSYSVIDGTVGNRIPWTEYDRFVAARARPGGGFVAAVSGTFPDHLPRLWNVEVDGTATVLGTYDLGPPLSSVGCTRLATGEISCGATGSSCALDASWALYCITIVARVSGDLVQGVVRFTLDGPPAIVYDERNSDVKMHSASLVTGP